MNKNVLLVSAMVIAFLFSSCKKDDTISKPVITIHEIGNGASHSNDHTAIIGADLHVEVEVVAEGKIDIVQLIIHPEGEHHKGGHAEWELDTTYTKFSGLKNTEFHEHLEIDLAAEPGDYHFDFIVTDMEGNQSSADADLKFIIQ